MSGNSVPRILSCPMKQLDTVLRGLFQASFFLGMLRGVIGRVKKLTVRSLHLTSDSLKGAFAVAEKLAKPSLHQYDFLLIKKPPAVPVGATSGLSLLFVRCCLCSVLLFFSE